jgi:hypothetical protein
MRALHLILSGASLLVLSGCGQKDYYVQTQTGPHGQITSSRKVYYTPEQKAARNEALGLAGPSDPKLVELEDLWPKLTEEQRAAVLNSARQMAAPR